MNNDPGSPLPLYNQTHYTREELIDAISARLDPVELTTILAAYEMASSVHEYQIRNDSTPYFWHLSRVARIIIHELEYINADVISAALLHDVLEDSDIITADVLKYNFNAYISYIVEVLTKNIRLLGVQREQENHEYIERLRYSSIDCKIVKFAERLDNYRCLEFGVKRNPFGYIEITERNYYPMARDEQNNILNRIIREMDHIKLKFFS
ncbi:MAG: bifunctional (p)ppGpp synthetase/guanosine-3',5'-bis(diphosphate) 3'-pyrophosphohydrolase [Bacteroidetes bacterium]|nr:bifunctional (p)ppGpp synthetase/guanosine-3',5'-bis(diphosphate) 3'-pyrophosphohydrolase [Bacteroidota bacterium]